MPYLLVPLVALAALALVGSPTTWLTLTIAGIAMGMLIFVMASGLTLVFGLMDVLNMGHGAFITLGTYVGTSVLLRLTGLTEADAFFANIVAVVAAIVVAMAVAAAVGWFFERVVVRPVYGDHLKQILVTMGGLIVAEQLIIVLWGPSEFTIARPKSLQGSFSVGEFVVEKFRLFAALLGLAIFLGMQWALNKTRLGLLIRAGVENREMVESLGYRIRRLFVGVFAAGCALAGLGGVMWGLYVETINIQIGMNLMILIFIVIIMGGLGSLNGCFIGALLVGLTANYVGFLAPKVALISNILLMVIVLLWRAEGLLAVSRSK
ncbi:MAG: branched-chain amino acid ABC transporter permease [Alphaproteobacteria bacterium]